MASVDIFCPQCDRYVGLKPACACGWARPEPVRCDATGQPAWRTPIGQPIMCRPVFWRDQIVLTCGARYSTSGGMVVLDAAGREAWRYDAGAGVEGGVALAGDLAVFGDDRGRVHGVDLKTRAAAWPPVELDGAISAAPLIDEVRAIVGTSHGLVATIDIRSGRITRRARLPSAPGFGRIAASPALWSRLALVSVLDGYVYDFDPIGGDLAPRYDFGAGIYTSPLVYRGPRTLMIVGTQTGELAALDMQTQRVAWRFQAGKPIRATPALSGDTAYFGAQDHRLYAIDARTGQALWQFEGEHGIVTTPLIAHGLVIFGDNHGALVAIAPPAGQDQPARQVWTFDVQADHPGLDDRPAAVFGGFAERNGMIVFGSYNGHVYGVPWHLGHHRQSASQAEADGQWTEAAIHVLLAGGDPADLDAARVLSRGGQHADAARIYEAIGEQIEAAQAYESAGRVTRLPVYWDRAAGLWSSLKHPDQARQCQHSAAEARNSPWLRVEVTSGATFKIGQSSILRLQVTNLMPAKARHVQLQLLGADLSACPPENCPELSDNHPWICECERVEPLRAGDIKIRLVARFQDRPGNSYEQTWEQTLTVAQRDQPPTIVEKMFTGETHITEVSGDMGMLKQHKG